MDLNEFFQSKEVTSHEKKWNVMEAMINESNEYVEQTHLKNNFYISSYECPCCNKPMYKTVFPVGHEYQVQTQIKTMHLKRVFTCVNCLSFFTAQPGSRLTDGILFTVKYDDKQEYINKLNDMDSKGSTTGREDL